MKPSLKLPSIEGGLIQGVMLVDQITRPRTGTFHAPSLPSHLIHLVLQGEVEQQVNGQIQHLTPGTAVWYYENEAVEGRILKAPWSFLTVNFMAIRLSPPPFEQRVWQASSTMKSRFQALLDAWCDANTMPLARHIRVFARLLDLLEAAPLTSALHRADASTHLWWEIEAKLREDLSQPIDLRFLQSLTGQSRHAIVQACRLAVGVSPMKRVKEMRLSYARGLVQHSRLTMTEIALRIGYSRVQELSRDYNQAFGCTPTEDRQAGPDYQLLHVPRKS